MQSIMLTVKENVISDCFTRNAEVFQSFSSRCVIDTTVVNGVSEDQNCENCLFEGLPQAQSKKVCAQRQKPKEAAIEATLDPTRQMFLHS